VGVITPAAAALFGDNLNARVKGWQTGNWGVALGDRVSEVGNNADGDAWFVSKPGDAPWVATNTYSFSLKYSSVTGLATFQVDGTGYTSTLLTTPDYDIEGMGFTGIDLGLQQLSTTTLTISDLVLNGSAIAGYGGSTSYVTNALYTGAVLGEIDLSGKFVMTGDYVGNNEGTKFDLYLKGLQQVPTPTVPEPGSLALVALSMLGLAATRRRKAA
jgi:hypothetical protein